MPSITLNVRFKSPWLNAKNPSTSIQRRISTEVQIASQALTKRVEEGSKRVFDSRLRNPPFTGRMRLALKSKPSLKTGGNTSGILTWGYFPDDVAGAGESEGIRGLQNYVSARERGWTGQALPPIKRIEVFMRVMTGKKRVRGSAKRLAETLMVGREGLKVIPIFRASAEYRTIFDGLGLNSVRAAITKEITSTGITIFRGPLGRFTTRASAVAAGVA